MPASASSIQKIETQQDITNGLLYHDLSPLRDLSGPNQYHTSDITSREHKDKMAGQPDQDAESKQPRPRLTIRELREAAQKEAAQKEVQKAALTSQANKAPQIPQETRRKSSSMPQKKPSILGGLFQVREPTQIALNQVATQMIAQHGSTSATKVPNVRLEKMPEFVPKVNSKWDGIPESVKRRERREKEKDKERNRKESSLFTNSKARSDNGKDKSRTNVGSRNSSSTTGSSFGAPASSIGSQGASSRTRFYTRSTNSSQDLASQQRTDASIFSPPLTSSSAFSLAESVSDMPSNPCRGSGLASTRSHYSHTQDLTREPRTPSSMDQPPASCATFAATTTREYGLLNPHAITRGQGGEEGSCKLSTDISVENSARYADAGMQPPESQYRPHTAAFLPYLTSSPARPQDVSPTAPPRLELQPPVGRGADDMTNLLVALSSSGSDLLSPLTAGKKKSGTKLNDAFLAGEARELVLPDDATGQSRDSSRSRIQQDLEKRPDSSRDRLGLRASMLFDDDTTPWGSKETTVPAALEPQIMKSVPNTKIKFHKPFGRVGKDKDKWKTTL
ncbi:hypothetical protein Z517_12447 [Fonsecaea pedrosoi CBS 271.37]|uniref:Uncharacterized protein n=1 Tax=Fonsecaea pedrosoi CBS 271.37 TaxID=1442368 RepID=A0A0D2EJJ6_9EURO|nr:uncharacterized protein Z517_12447 [Fonsecaea pedrosoi CBS 271.37]KIW74507.1 hypothetical protein Z517_12447 [Fonsecaea pedrosoi CBS 271.37]